MAEQGICIYTKTFQIQVESLKYDVQEKTDLLQEAGLALEQLENKISRMTIEREEEKSRLEAKLQQMEDDLNDSQIRLFDDGERAKLRACLLCRSALTPAGQCRERPSLLRVIHNRLGVELFVASDTEFRGFGPVAGDSCRRWCVQLAAGSR